VALEDLRLLDAAAGRGEGAGGGVAALEGCVFGFAADAGLIMADLGVCLLFLEVFRPLAGMVGGVGDGEGDLGGAVKRFGGGEGGQSGRVVDNGNGGGLRQIPTE